MLVPYPWQWEDAAKLAAQPRWLLANEMRTGKTGTTFVAAALVGAARMLVVCPAIVRAEWERQMLDFLPLGAIDLRTASYEQVSRDGLPALMRGWRPDVLVLDECHYLKSPVAKRTRACYGRWSEMVPYVWALSGTPAPNHPGEYWTHLHFFGATKLGDDAFLRRYCVVVDTRYGPKVRGLYAPRIAELKSLLTKWSSRRTQKMVWAHTPEPFWSVRALRAPAQVRNDIKALEAPYAAQARVNPMATMGKMATERHVIGDHKAPLAIAHTLDLLAGGVGKVLVGVWHSSVAEAMVAGLVRYNPGVIVGSTPAKVRDEAIRRFQTDTHCRVIVVQMRAGGTGVNLSAADHIVIVEPDWGRDVNLQFGNRAQHLKRTTPLPVDLLVIEGTLDEAIVRATNTKSKMAKTIEDVA